MTDQERLANVAGSERSPEMVLRTMTPADLTEVTQLGISSKARWGYSPEMMAIFATELTVDAAGLNALLSAEVITKKFAGGKEHILGYYTMCEHSDGGVELKHLFIHPDYFRQGIGCSLLQAAFASLANNRIDKLVVIADPHSVGFYEKYGAVQVGEHQSSVSGRTIPVLEFTLEDLQ